MRARLLLLAAVAMVFGGGVIGVIGQQTDDTTRKLWDTAFVGSANKTTTRRRSRTYRIATPKVPIDQVMPDSVVGVTIWRLRPGNESRLG